MNNFIVTNFGFIKSIVFNNTTHQHDVDYTDKLRYAQSYNSKTAKSVMTRFNIVGFIYNPYAEEPVRDMYEVKKITHSSFFSSDDELIGEYQAVKAIMVHESDVNFLLSGKLKVSELYSLEDATAKAMEMNVKLLKELHEKINKQNFDLHMMKTKDNLTKFINND